MFSNGCFIRNQILVGRAGVESTTNGLKGAYAISTDKGETHLSAITLSAWAVQSSALPDFQTKRIRSGLETLLASARIISDIRGRPQSHGITGVQARHYDGHDYLEEKRQALETLHRLLEAPGGRNVVQLRRLESLNF